MFSAGNKLAPTNQPSFPATLLLVVGLVLTYNIIQVGVPSEMVRTAAWWVGSCICVAFAIEIHLKGLRNFFRPDNVAIFALYFLTLFEFLFPQPQFNAKVTGEQTFEGLFLVLIGIGAIATGRHVSSPRPLKSLLATTKMSNRELFWMAVGCFVLGHLYMWLAVGFNFGEWLSQMTGQRFTQDWQRGKMGGWQSILTELHWLTFIIPAIAGYLWMRRHLIPRWQLLGALVMLGLTLYEGIFSGTRYQMGFYLLSLGGGYFLANREIRLSTALIIGGTVTVMFLTLVFVVVNYRNLGLGTAISVLVTDQHEGYTGVRREVLKDDEFKFIVDRNMYSLSMLPAHFPEHVDFLHEEVVVAMITRPIPRALWSGKPESLSVTLEGVLGIDDHTLASTIVGESFMAYGTTGVILFSLGFGALLGAWNRIPVPPDHPNLIVLYSLGFVWSALAVRSILWISIGFIPVVAFFICMRFILPGLRSLKGRRTE